MCVITRRVRADQELRNVLIIGAGDAGSDDRRNRQRLQSEYRLIGFVDDDTYKKGK